MLSPDDIPVIVTIYSAVLSGAVFIYHVTVHKIRNSSRDKWLPMQMVHNSHAHRNINIFDNIF